MAGGKPAPDDGDDIDAADADRLLPADVDLDVQGAVGGPVQYSSRSELFRKLCAGILLDGGAQAHWLDATTGKVCRAASARSANITWGDNTDYWTWQPSGSCAAGGDGCRFAEVAYLEKVWWFAISGEVKVRLPADTYTVSAREWPSTTSRCPNGWDDHPVTLKLGLDGEDGQPLAAEVSSKGYLREHKPTSAPVSDAAAALAAGEGDRDLVPTFELRKAEGKWLELHIESVVVSQYREVPDRGGVPVVLRS